MYSDFAVDSTNALSQLAALLIFFLKTSSNNFGDIIEYRIAQSKKKDWGLKVRVHGEQWILDEEYDFLVFFLGGEGVGVYHNI